MYVCGEGSQLDEICRSKSCDQNGVLMCNDCKQFIVMVLKNNKKKPDEYNDDNPLSLSSVYTVHVTIAPPWMLCTVRTVCATAVNI